ncbi:MAG: heme-binding domain-containing protein [Deltaproteobacteria bacterium]|nr:heme-binding domain-containing protein [Deltaproteobacteria bacterium]
MRKKKFIHGFLVLFVLIQLIPLKRSNPPIETEVAFPRPLAGIFHRACYNCHSNETVWPWYSYLAPISWIIAQDVSEARQKMNFTAWNRLDRQKIVKRIRDIGEAVNNGDMPPWYYRIIHPEARLTKKEKQRIRNWSLDQEQGIRIKEKVKR